MAEPESYRRLADLTPATAHLDDIEMDSSLWATLYEHAHQTPPPPRDIAEITHLWAISPEGWSSTNIAALGRLTDDRWFTVVAWSDTSGFDCQGDVDWHTADTREAAVSQGLDKEARAHLGLALATERTEQP